MNTLKSKILVAIFMTFSMQSFSHAGIIIEPILGFIPAGTSDQLSDSMGLTLDYEHSGPTYGGRIGYDYLGLIMGFTYMKSNLEVELAGPTSLLNLYKSSGTSTKTKYDGTTMGAFLGFSLPLFLRAWATYLPDINWEVTEGSSSGDNYSGKGLGLGLGFSLIPLLSLNLEYQVFSLDTHTDFSTGAKSKLSNKINGKQALISLSVPLSF